MSRAETPLLGRINHLIRTKALPTGWSAAPVPMCSECGINEATTRMGLCRSCHAELFADVKCLHCNRPAVYCCCV